MDISERLHQAYMAKGLSYKELEKIAMVPSATIQRYVMGLTDRIDIDKLEAICRALDLDVVEVLGWGKKQETENDRLNAEIIRLISRLSFVGKRKTIDYIHLLLMSEGKK